MLYRGTAVEFVEDRLKLKLNISTKIKAVFAVLPIRSIVERTFAWLNGFRRLAKDVEILTAYIQDCYGTSYSCQITMKLFQDSL